MVLGLVGLHKGGEDVQFISGLGAGLGIPQLFEAEQRTLMIPFGFDGINIRGSRTLSDVVYIDLVILLMWIAKDFECPDLSDPAWHFKSPWLVSIIMPLWEHARADGCGNFYRQKYSRFLN
ncbi:MAG: hypothetical protein K0S45_3972 [Nitrospira sp.]|jgi:hypothetical protein|nr:hypothetical protein [Nitrospira sp.]